MSRLNVWHEIPVNTSNRPILVQGETELFSSDHVGLYQGKSKFRALQNGRVYLTSKRVMFLDSQNVCAVGVYLRLLSRAEYIDKFLRSSPKVKLYLRPEEGSQADSAPLISDWVCTVCSYNNHYDHKSEHIPKCVACGISASAAQVSSMQDTAKVVENVVSETATGTATGTVSKIVSATASESASESATGSASKITSETASKIAPESVSARMSPGQCPKCTFLNHPSMRFCEMCASPLKVSKMVKSRNVGRKMQDVPSYLQLSEPEVYTNNEPYIKISFRKGGSRQFYELATSAIESLKWKELQAKGAVNKQATRLAEPANGPIGKVVHGGISAIEKSDEMKRLNNERVLSSSLNDLEQLMYKAQEVLQLTQSFSSLVKKKGQFAASEARNISEVQSPMELARNLSEYLMDFELTRPTSMATVQDVFASYNRYRLASQGFGGQLVGTDQMLACMQYFDKLQLPVKTKTFSSGLTVMTQRNNNSENELHHIILEYMIGEENSFMLAKFQSELVADSDGYMKSQLQYFHGKSVVDIAEHFGWATTICMEEVERCLEKALLVKDNHISGTFYHVNKFDRDILQRLTDHETLRKSAKENVVVEQNGISAHLQLQYTSTQSLVVLQEYEFGSEGKQGEASCDQPVMSEAKFSESLMELDGLKFE